MSSLLQPSHSLARLHLEETRNFYSMLLDWRIQNKSYSEMINLFVNYWRKLYQRDNEVTVYVGRWGDCALQDKRYLNYTKFKNKDRTKIVNLAIVRVKEEQDFVDNTLMKFVEVLHDLNMVDEKFYNEVKYGTDIPEAICLIKNGLSLNSALLLINKYQHFLDIDCCANTVKYLDGLVFEMEKNAENQIQIKEITTCI